MNILSHLSFSGRITAWRVLRFVVLLVLVGLFMFIAVDWLSGLVQFSIVIAGAVWLYSSRSDWIG